MPLSLTKAKDAANLRGAFAKAPSVSRGEAPPDSGDETGRGGETARRVNVSVPASLHKGARLRALERDLTLQELVEAALEQYLSAGR